MLMARKSKLAGALALSIGLAAAGCAGMPTNTSLYSPNQPVVERTNFTFDVQTDSSGLPIGEQSRLNGWFVGQVLPSTGGQDHPDTVNQMVADKRGL